MVKIGSNNTAFEEKLAYRLNATGLANVELSKSAPGKRLEKRIADVNKILHEAASLGDPSLALTLERHCIEFEKDFFARNDKEHERYDKQLSELASAGQSLKLVQDAETYRQHVKDAYGPHREVKFAPAGESYRTVVDKLIKQLGRDKHGMASPKIKELYDLRQASLRAGLNAFIELQCKALGLASPQKGKERGQKHGLER